MRKYSGESDMEVKRDAQKVEKRKVAALKIIVYIVMGLTVLLVFFMPRFLGNSTGFLTSNLNYGERTSVMIYIILCCIPFLFALFIVKRICDLITQGDSFSTTTLGHLSLIVTCCYLEAAVNIVAIIATAIFLDFQIYSINALIIGICGAVAVFTTVLKELVKSAIRLREENELTI